MCLTQVQHTFLLSIQPLHRTAHLVTIGDVLIMCRMKARKRKKKKVFIDYVNCRVETFWEFVINFFFVVSWKITKWSEWNFLLDHLFPQKWGFVFELVYSKKKLASLFSLFFCSHPFFAIFSSFFATKIFSFSISLLCWCFLKVGKKKTFSQRRLKDCEIRYKAKATPTLNEL